MINKQTVQSLNLKNYTIKNCLDMYNEMANKYQSISDLENALLKANSDPEFLNKMWWVLNYHSDRMDHSRRLRAILETRLDILASNKENIYS